MRGVIYSKLVFLDSQDGVRGAKALRPTFTVPSNDFSVGNEESMHDFMFIDMFPKEGLHPSPYRKNLDEFVIPENFSSTDTT